jgi:mRNA-degrading endonuclease RelE of RelBE toxin-antitoxin system
MKNEVQWSEQVRTFVAGLAPGPRRKLRAGIRGLAGDRGDTQALVDDLLGYKRLRVSDFRVIYREAFEKGVPVRKCLFAERRNIVYELFRKMVLDDIR